jgi:hypothetical protein
MSVEGGRVAIAVKFIAREHVEKQITIRLPIGVKSSWVPVISLIHAVKAKEIVLNPDSISAHLIFVLIKVIEKLSIKGWACFIDSCGCIDFLWVVVRSPSCQQSLGHSSQCALKFADLLPSIMDSMPVRWRKLYAVGSGVAIAPEVNNFDIVVGQHWVSLFCYRG